ncbi:MAG TPA: YrhA family protein [Chthoniobacterales bacterium]
MHTIRDYLKELSDLFVSDLHASAYYRGLPPAERARVDRRLINDAAEGFFPLVPGALASDVELLAEEVEARLGIEMPAALEFLLGEIDGFVENGTTFYSIDTELTEGEPAARPGIVAENERLWHDVPELAKRWLAVGDNELSLFACRLDDESWWALDRSSFTTQHQFDGPEGLLRFMLRTALRLPLEGAEGRVADPGLN